MSSASQPSADIKAIDFASQAGSGHLEIGYVSTRAESASFALASVLGPSLASAKAGDGQGGDGFAASFANHLSPSLSTSGVGGPSEFATGGKSTGGV